jgi:3-hydroxyisobutyrate dehydrogenase
VQAAIAQVESTLPPIIGLANIAGVSSPTAVKPEELVAAAPPVRHEPRARGWIRAAHAAAARRIAVLDDDPTGSQTVHDVSVVTVFENAEYAAGLAEPGSTCFVLTNTRSLAEDTAVELTTGVASSLFTLGQTLGAPVDVVSRSDSTLRGHVFTEMRAIDAARRTVCGTGFDGVLLVPAYFEAGRFTAGDIHWAVVSGQPVPVGASEFARDATFGYTSSNLREFVAEKSNGTIDADEVHSISLTDIREGGPELYGDGKAAAALKPGSVVLLMATVGPAAVEDWARRLAASGAQIVDAPVSGGAARAGQGDLLIMVSGSETALATVQPILEVMARNAPVVGAHPGDGQKVKLVNQLLCGVHIAVAAEALAYAEALGLDAGQTWEVLRHGAAASFMLDDRGARMIHNPNNEIRSTIDIFVKDMGLVTEAARAKAYPAPLASAAEQLYLAGRRAGLGRADDSSVIQILRGTASAST